MLRFLESSLGQIIARNGILALILAVSMYQNHIMVEKLFTLIERQIAVSTQVLEALNEIQGKRSVIYAR